MIAAPITRYEDQEAILEGTFGGDHTQVVMEHMMAHAREGETAADFVSYRETVRTFRAISGASLCEASLIQKNPAAEAT